MPGASVFARRALRMTAGGAPAAAELDVKFGGVLLRDACLGPFDAFRSGIGGIGGLAMLPPRERRRRRPAARSC